MKRSLKLMTDYDCFPIWEPSGPQNVDPPMLPISADLRDALYVWADTYDDTLDRDDPLRSGFLSIETETAFRNQGELLRDRLQLELGHDYIIKPFFCLHM